MNIYQGKTKEFIKVGDTWRFRFKDTLLGRAGELDAGGNEVVGNEPGRGADSLKIAQWTFAALCKAGIPTHYRGMDGEYMLVAPADRIPLEVVVRNRAAGSFLHRYRGWTAPGDELPALVEFTLKDDQLDDPLLTAEAALALDVLRMGEADRIVALAREVNGVLRERFAAVGLELVDFKLEFGRVRGERELMVIDAIDGNSLRAMREGTFTGLAEMISCMGL